MADDVSGVDPAQARIGDILRTAIPASEDAPIEDETRRLMLHLSLERPEPQGGLASDKTPEPVKRAPAHRMSLLRQMLKLPRKRRGGR